MRNSTDGFVLSLLPQQMVETLAWKFRVTSDAVRNGIGSSTTALICGIAERAGDSIFMTRLFNLIHESEKGSVLRSFPDSELGVQAHVSTDLGEAFASMVFGNKQTAVENMVGRVSGLGAFAGRELMSLAASLTLVVLQHQIHDRGLKVSSFAKHMESEAAQTQGMLSVAIKHLLAGGFIPSTDVPLSTVLRRSSLVKEGVLLAGMIVLALAAFLY